MTTTKEADVIGILDAATKAYADCNRLFEDCKRELNFEAPGFVSIDEAVEIFRSALGPNGTYNEFRPDLLYSLKALFDQPTVRVERHSSVTITIRGQTKEHVTAALVKRAMVADSTCLCKSTSEMSIWWD